MRQHGTYSLGHEFEDKVLNKVLDEVCPDLIFRNVLYASKRNYPIFEQDIIILKDMRVMLIECKCHKTDKYIDDNLFSSVKNKTRLFNTIANVKSTSVIVTSDNIKTGGCSLALKDIRLLNTIINQLPPNKNIEQLVRTVSTSRQMELTKLKGGHI